MPTMTNILVKDDTATTPVEYTLEPVTDTPTPLWRTAVAGVPLAGQIRASLAMDDLKSGGTKVSVKLEVPVMESLGTAGTSAGYVAPAKVAYVNTAITSCFLDARATTQDTANLLKMHLGLLQGASATTATGVLNQASAGNAFVNSTLLIVQSIIRRLKPN